MNKFSGSIQNMIIRDITGGTMDLPSEIIENNFEERDNESVVNLYGRLLAFLSEEGSDWKYAENGYATYSCSFILGEINDIFNTIAIKEIQMVCIEILSNRKKKVEKAKISVMLFYNGLVVDIDPFDSSVEMNKSVTKNFLLNHFNKIMLALRKYIKLIKVKRFGDICDEDEIYKSDSFSELNCVNKDGSKYYGPIEIIGIKSKPPALIGGISDDLVNEYVKKIMDTVMKKKDKLSLLKMLIPILNKPEDKKEDKKEDKILKSLC
jgi:hypothetical protein